MRRGFVVVAVLVAVAAIGSVQAAALLPLVVTSTTTDANALRDALLIGTGITPVGNATFVGGGTSGGFFKQGQDSIKLKSGVLLTTGDATYAMPPNVYDSSGATASASGDADLNTLVPGGSGTMDTCYLKFDFMTATGKLYFNFVFASEEYNEFANSQYNDVFGFFVDGKNIAFIPGTTTPVTINTINGGNPLGTNPKNPQYYNNNDPGDSGPMLDLLGYDGFTTVFVAEANGLGPGTHTVKLAISDVGDMAWDSGVFLYGFSQSLNPVADPDGPYSLQPGEGVTLDGSGSFDLDGTIVDYLWQCGALSYDAGTNPTSFFDWAQLGSLFGITGVGNYTLTLTVTDNVGLTGSNSTLLTVFQENVVIPEPATLTLLGGALAGLLIRRRRQR